MTQSIESLTATQQATFRREIGSDVFSYKTQSGLRRWRQNLGMAGKTGAGNGLGGVDVVCIGDSIMEGQGATNSLFDSFQHRLKVKLQDKYNPADVPGGFGFLPTARASNTPLNWWTMEGSPTLVDPSYGVGYRRTNYNPSNGERIRYAFDGTSNRFLREGVTDLQFAVVANNTWDSAGVSWDVSDSDAYVTVGTGNVATGSDAGVDSTPLDAAYRGSRITGLSSSSMNCFQLSAASGVAWYCGAFAYNGDWQAGVRLHGLGNGSLNTTSATQSDGNSGALKASVDAFGTATGSGATNAKLFILNLLTNDIGTSSTPDFTVATFKANYQTLITRILGLTSKPCIMLSIPPARNDANYLSNVGPFREAMYELADENDHVCILDFWKMFDDEEFTQSPTDAGWDSGDGVHLSDTGYEAQASHVANLLT